MADDEYEEEIDIDSIDDEQTLIEMLDETEDFDERKRVRDRLMKVQHEIRSKRGARLQQIQDERDQKLKQKVKDADEKKERTLAMYDQMAKTKVMDVNIYKHNDASSRPDTPVDSTKRVDLVEETIRQRVRDADMRKKRILAAYDHAAKSAPAGVPRIVDFTAFRRADVSDFNPTTQTTGGSSTFSMAGGVSKTDKASSSKPGTPVGPKGAPNFQQQNEEYLDPMERAIRQRQKEADERKRRTLAAYDIVAKTGGVGPKVVILEEFRDLKVTPEMKMGPACDPTASFRCGVVQTAGGRR